MARPSGENSLHDSADGLKVVSCGDVLQAGVGEDRPDDGRLAVSDFEGEEATGVEVVDDV